MVSDRFEWAVATDEYATMCRYLDLQPSEALRQHLNHYLTQMSLSSAPHRGFQAFVMTRRLGPIGLRAIDLWTRLRVPTHPWRYRLNGVIAIHECDATEYARLIGSGQPRTIGSLLLIIFDCAVTLLVTPPYISALAVRYLASTARAGDAGHA